MVKKYSKIYQFVAIEKEKNSNLSVKQKTDDSANQQKQNIVKFDNQLRASICKIRQWIVEKKFKNSYQKKKKNMMFFNLPQVKAAKYAYQ